MKFRFLDFFYKNMAKKVLFVVANVGFQDHEFAVPYEAVKNAGYEVSIASGRGGVCRGVFMKRIDGSLKFSEVVVQDYDLVIFVGGGWAYDQYYLDDAYLALGNQAKAVAAICIAPTLLSDAGIYQGKQLTGRDDGLGTQIRYLQKNWATFVDQPVVRDGNLITANGPEAAEEFALEVLKLLDEKD